MTETLVEQGNQEPQTEHEKKIEEHPRERFDFMKWLRGSNTKEFTENTSFLVIVISAIMVSTGIGLGSFVQGTVLIAVVGAFFVMVGIIVYMISQFIGE